jgi:type I restriction enzyme, S subunit
MSAAWQTVPLGEVVNHRKEFITIDELETYRRPRVQLHAQGIVLRDAVPGALIKTKKQQVVRAGEFLVAEIDAKVGGFGLVPDVLDGAIVSSHYFLYAHRPDRLDNKFLGWFVKTRAFREQVEAQGSTNYAAVRAADVLGYKIPLPALDEQRRIVARIEQLAAKVDEARTARAFADRELSALYAKLLFSAFGAVDTSPTSIGAEFVVTTGGTPSRANLSFWGGQNAWVSSGEVAFRDITDTREKITDVGLNESNAKIYPPGTVLLAMIGQGKTRGQCAILRCAAATNQNVAGIHVAKTNHSPRYVYWWLYANYQKSRSTETGTAQPALSADRVKQMRIPLPDRNQQDKIVAQLDALQAKVDAVKALQTETAAELDAMIPAILDKAFKGEM